MTMPVGPRHLVAFSLALLLWLLPGPSLAEDPMGGITFIGEREGVCVLIEGECVAESIYFKLDTCDANQHVKEQFRDRTPFSLLVPKGTHRLVIMKEGRKVISDTITITPDKVLEYKLP